MRKRGDKPAFKAGVFELSAGWTPLGTAMVLFPLFTVVGFCFVLTYIGIDRNPMLLLGLIFAFAGCGSLIALAMPRGDSCIRAAFEGDDIRLTGSLSGEVVVPARSIELAVERPPKTERRAASTYILYGPFGRLRLRPKGPKEAQRLDDDLRKSAKHALYIPATEGVARWQWPRTFDRASLEKSLRWEAATRVRSSVVIGAVMTCAGATMLGLVVGIILGVLPSDHDHSGRAVGGGLMFLGYGIYLLITTHRSVRWRDACLRMVNGRVHAPFPCPACGYDLGGLIVGVACPECGTVPPPEVPLDVRAGM